MSDVLTIARNDFKSTRRAKLLWGVVAVYVLLMVIVLFPAGGAEETPLVYSLFGATWLTTLVLPLVAIAGSYLAIAGERESNTIRFLLAQPTARRSVVLGKFLSRGLTLGIALVAALVASVAVIATAYPALDARSLLLFFGLSALLVAAYVAVSIAISAAVASRSRAITGTIGFYFVTVMLSVFPGSSITAVLRRLLGGVLGIGLGDDTYTLLSAILSPAVAYMRALFTIFPSDAAGMVPETVPAFLDLPAMTGLLALWILVPLAVGTVLLDRAEIG